MIVLNYTANIQSSTIKHCWGGVLLSKYLLKCIDCGVEFFTEGEKDFYESKDNWKSQMRYDAINNAVRMIEDYYDNSVKKTNDVLAMHQQYFKSLGDTKDIAVDLNGKLVGIVRMTLGELETQKDRPLVFTLVFSRLLSQVAVTLDQSTVTKP